MLHHLLVIESAYFWSYKIREDNFSSFWICTSSVILRFKSFILKIYFEENIYTRLARYTISLHRSLYYDPDHQSNWKRDCLGFNGRQNQTRWNVNKYFRSHGQSMGVCPVHEKRRLGSLFPDLMALAVGLGVFWELGSGHYIRSYVLSVFLGFLSLF